MTRIVTVVQARCSSTRLPGKIFLPLEGAPLLARMVERVRAARLAGDVVVATTTDAGDDRTTELCGSHEIPCFRGHPSDLLDRHVQCARARGADVVIKIPSDCPLIDPAVIDRVIEDFLRGGADYVSNLHPATYPDGQDVEVMTLAVLERAWREARRDFEREHTTPFLWERPDEFRLRNVAWETGLDLSMSHRLTIDYPEDYELIRAVYAHLFPGKSLFGLADIMALFERRPELLAINARYAGVNWYRHHLDALTTIRKDQTKIIP
jgi:spore coat polysaccharide biosynthesis protein SpsF